MSSNKISFPNMPWEHGAHPLETKKATPGAALLCFEVGFADPNWCENGHVGFIVEGALAFELEEGSMELGAGEAFVIDPGTRHRASNPGDRRTVLFIAPR